MNPQFEIFEPRIIKSDPNLPMQMVHGDNTVIASMQKKSECKLFGGMVVSCIVAIQENTKINIQIGSALKKIHIPKGSMIMFNANSPHAGPANKTDSAHYRLHFSMKKPDVELVEDTITFFQQCEWCKKLYRAGNAISFHRRDCGKRNDAYAMERKRKHQVASKRSYYEKKSKKLNHSNAAKTLLLLKQKGDK